MQRSTGKFLDSAAEKTFGLNQGCKNNCVKLFNYRAPISIMVLLIQFFILNLRLLEATFDHTGRNKRFLLARRYSDSEKRSLAEEIRPSWELRDGIFLNPLNSYLFNLGLALRQSWNERRSISSGLASDLFLYLEVVVLFLDCTEIISNKIIIEKRNKSWEL